MSKAKKTGATTLGAMLMMAATTAQEQLKLYDDRLRRLVHTGWLFRVSLEHEGPDADVTRKALENLKRAEDLAAELLDGPPRQKRC